MLSYCDATFPSCSLAYAMRASLLAWDYPCYKYYAPSGPVMLVVVRNSLFVKELPVIKTNESEIPLYPLPFHPINPLSTLTSG
jgi:hypothetical protein